MVKKQGNEYQLVKIEKDKSFYQYEIVILDTVKLKKIKEAKIYQVTAENKSSMYGAFSYSGYLHKEAKGEIKANSSGGPRTIINVIFTDNTFVSLDVADDPIWFEAKKGMNVEIYECNNATFYKLLFD